jgi:hypothetical protein
MSVQGKEAETGVSNLLLAAAVVNKVSVAAQVTSVHFLLFESDSLLRGCGRLAGAGSN